MLDKNVTYFLKTVEEGNLTKAARSLSISQPALSMGLNGLEKKLGFRLLNRRTTPVTLTEEGKIYLKYIRSINQLETGFEKQIADSISQSSRKIVVGAPLVYAETLLADYIENNGSDADFIVKVGSQSELQTMLENAEIDCYISTSDEQDEECEKKVIGSEKVFLCILKTEEKKIADYAQLDKERFVLLESDQPLRKLTDEFFLENGIRPSVSVICNQVSTSISYALKGAGMCFASKEALTCKNVEDRFDLLELPDRLFRRSIYIVYSKTGYQSEQCLKMINRLSKEEL